MSPHGASDIITLFAELILPVPIPKSFTYRVPFDLNDRIKAGQRAIVPFGPKKILTGVIARIHERPPVGYEAKYILELLDESEIVYPQQFALYEWIASYYMCTQGEVLNAALPSGLKLSSESMIQLHPSFIEEETQFDFSEREIVLLRHLKQETLTYTEASKILGARNIYSILKSLTSRDAIILFEQVKEKYKPRTEKRIRLQQSLASKKELEKLFDQYGSKPKQEAVLLKYLQLVPVFQDATLNKKGAAKAELLDNDISESSLSTLIKNNILEEFEVVVPRFKLSDAGQAPPTLLSPAQEAVRNDIIKQFEEKEAILLYGVTGSGKTEIYIDLIRRALEGGSQVLYLLPEIALTTQIVQRLQRIFGTELGVYHSKFSDNERVEVWNGVLQGKFRFVIGVRSSIFLPFDNLALIIVDEEHEPSYKQNDPAPRYNARDVAHVMARQHHAKVLMGSATPSVETYYQALTNKYGLVTLPERFGEAKLPDVKFANQVQERKDKTNKGEFSSMLLKETGATLKTGEQVIIFQNRRGYSPIVRCEDCSWVPRCVNCSVSLTYHQARHAMVCHYCGYRESLPPQCPVCSSRRILTLGYGTEKLEEELKLHFPDARIMRMDLDTTRTKSGYENIIDSFQNGETDILIGTQMVTKGLDFSKVTLVGVFDADRMMHFPDFRSYERAFQLITQVSGRAGRRDKQGKVVIQTFNPRHPLFSYVLQNDVAGFLREQISDRERNLYPPFSRLIEITIKHVDKQVANDAALWMVTQLKELPAGMRIMGPAEPMVNRVRNEFLVTILLKIPRNQGKLSETKVRLLEIATHVQERKEWRQVKIQFDVDPS
jgi:primosomal protein N' (replication factor Y)